MMKKTWMIASVFALGCSVESEPIDDVEGLDQDDVTLEIVDNLREVGFPDSEIEVRDDGLVFVGGDAEVNLEASREMLGFSAREPMEGDSPRETADAFRQYRTNNLVSASVDVICIDGSSFNGTLSTGLNFAIDNYNALGLGFSMQRTNGSTAGCDAEIVAIPTGGTGGSAGFPSGGQPYGQIFIGTGLANFGNNVAEHVIAHELGHCIGFRHTDWFNRSISCGSGGSEGQSSVGAVHIPGTPTGANFGGSLMNACFNGGVDGEFTASDITALNALYGGGGGGGADPDSCQQTNSCGGQAPGGCWCDNQCVGFGDCCSDGPC